MRLFITLLVIFSVIAPLKSQAYVSDEEMMIYIIWTESQKDDLKAEISNLEYKIRSLENELSYCN